MVNVTKLANWIKTLRALLATGMSMGLECNAAATRFATRPVRIVRDPLHHLSHGATPMQTARFFYLLETGRLVGTRLTREMKSMLGDPGIHHNFVKGFADYPDVRIYRKSGTWRQWHADSALVEAQDHRYIIVALTGDPDGGHWLSRLIQPIHLFMVATRLASSSH